MTCTSGADVLLVILGTFLVTSVAWWILTGGGVPREDCW